MRLKERFKLLTLNGISENIILTGAGITMLFMSISISAVELGVAIAILGWIIKCAAKRKVVLGELKFALPLLLFLVFLVISFLFTPHSATGKTDLFKLSWHALFYFAVISSFKIKDRMRLIFGLLAISVFISSVYGVLQYFFSINYFNHNSVESYGKRVFGFFSHPNNFASVLSMGIPMILYFLILPACPGRYWGKPLFKGGVFSAALLAGLCLLFTFSRGAWLGFLIGGVLWLFFYRKKFIIPALAAILVIFVLMPKSLKVHVTKRVTDSVNIKAYSTYTRMAFWPAALKMGISRPLTGVGLGNFREIFNWKYKNPAWWDTDHRDCHNNYLQLAGETGFLTLIFFSWFIVRVLITIFSHLRINPVKDCLVLLTVLFSITQFLVNGIFDCTLWQIEASVLFWFCCAIAVKTIEPQIHTN